MIDIEIKNELLKQLKMFNNFLKHEDDVKDIVSFFDTDIEDIDPNDFYNIQDTAVKIKKEMGW